MPYKKKRQSHHRGSRRPRRTLPINQRKPSEAASEQVRRTLMFAALLRRRLAAQRVALPKGARVWRCRADGAAVVVGRDDRGTTSPRA